MRSDYCSPKFRLLFIIGLSFGLFFVVQFGNNYMWWQHIESNFLNSGKTQLLKMCKNNTVSTIDRVTRVAYYTNNFSYLEMFDSEIKPLPCFKRIQVDTPGCYNRNSKWKTFTEMNLYFDLQLYLKHSKHFSVPYAPLMFGDRISEKSTYVVGRTRRKNVVAPLFKMIEKRHFGLMNLAVAKDHIPFQRKKDMLVWRGSALTGMYGVRRTLIERMHDLNKSSLVNLASTENKKDRLSVVKLLEYKLLLMVEGNDVSSGLMWALASSSAVVMPHPTVESWQMHFKMKPFVHYIPVRSTFEDLDDAVKWCMKNKERCESIGKEGQCFAANFVRSSENEILNDVADYIDRVAKKVCGHC